jgi:heme-degrading monooxygenase HmoA
MIAQTPEPPYYAVIFTSERTIIEEGYADTAERMVFLAGQQPGYLGHESARDGIGITVSYWRSLEDIRNWKQQAEHLIAQEKGREKWYENYKTRICKVERDYAFNSESRIASK